MLDVKPQQASLAPLRHIAQALSTTVDLDSTLQLIAQKTTEVMAVDSCTIYLIDPDSDLLRIRATTGLARRTLGRSTLVIGQGMTGQAVARKRPVFAADAQSHPDFKPVDRSAENQFRSLLAVPLVLNDEPLGALNVQTVAEYAFNATEIELISLIADLAAGAISKARLYETQHAQLEELRAVAHLSETVTTPQVLHEMLDVVTQLAAKTMQAAVCSLFLVDESRQALVLQSATKVTHPYGHAGQQPADAGVFGQVVQTGKLMHVPDISAEPHFANPERARAEGLASMLAVPLRVRGAVTGVLCCYKSHVYTFSTNEISLFSTLANQTALALENMRLATNAALVREMHHRIKNNLQTVTMLMQLQMADAAELDPQEILALNINRIQTIAAVHEVLSEDGFHLVDVKDVLTRIMSLMDSFIRPGLAVAVQVVGEPFSLPSREATSLALVVNELVQNAIEHAFADRDHGTVDVSLGRSPDEWIIVVADDGSGMDDTTTAGLGLTLADNLIHDDLGGTLTHRQRPVGTEFSIRVPRHSVRLA